MVKKTRGVLRDKRGVDEVDEGAESWMDGNGGGNEKVEERSRNELVVAGVLLIDW